MPLYEYKCQSCGEVFEIIQKFSDTPLTVHEKCGGQVERLISTSALVFKGGGWYVNDYGKGNSKDPGAKPPDKNGSSKTDDKKSEKSASSSEGSSKSDSSSKAESSAKSDKSSKTESSSATSTPSKSDSK